MPTTNPVPSTDPTDLLFNAGKLDEVVNGTANSFTDRLGVSRRTVAGMNADFDAQLADAESELNVYRADAAASAAEALGYLQTIRATSYGAYAEDPATDPLGNPPTVGDEYFNTTANLLKRWNGATWQASDINTANLAASSGSSLVGYDGGTVQDVLDGAKSLQSYTALRAYTGRATRIYITGLLVTAKPAGIAGVFQYDPTDTTSLDNGGTIIVGADGRRWKRDFSGYVMASWFGTVGLASTNEHSALQAAFDFCVTQNKTLFISNGIYLLANAILAIRGGITIIGEDETKTVIRAAKADLSAPDGISGSAKIFSVLNTVPDAKIYFETLTLDGGVTSIYKTLNTLGLSALSGWGATTGNETVKKLSLKNCTVKNCGSEGITSKNYIYYNSSADFKKVFDYAEYVGCTFESIGFGACNINGAQKIVNCTFKNQAVIEHAHHRGDGFLEVIDCVFENAGRPNRQTISILNEKDPMTGTADDYDARKNTRAIIQGNTFRNTYDWINGWPSTKTWLQSVAVKETGTLIVKDNLFVNAAFGSASGGGVVATENWIDNVKIAGNTISITDTYFITTLTLGKYTDAEMCNLLEIKNNTTQAEYPLNIRANLYNVADNPKPDRFISSGNNISTPINQVFAASLSTAYSVNLPVRRTFSVRVIMNIAVSVATTIQIQNASSGIISTVYNATPAVGTIHAAATFTTDNLVPTQYISQFLVKSSSDVSNTFTLEFEEI